MLLVSFPPTLLPNIWKKGILVMGMSIMCACSTPGRPLENLSKLCESVSPLWSAQGLAVNPITSSISPTLRNMDQYLATPLSALDRLSTPYSNLKLLVQCTVPSIRTPPPAIEGSLVHSGMPFLLKLFLCIMNRYYRNKIS